MADLRNSSEIVTQKELEPVLNSSRFDSATFLRLYNEWKATKDTGTFAELRKMHEDAGYNNKNIIFGAEQEMHEIAAIVQKYQDSKNVVTTTAATAASGVRQSVPNVPVPTQEITEDSIKKQSLDIKKSLDVMTMEKLESSLKLTESLAKMIPSTHTTLGRGVIGSMMLGRLQELGYSLSVDANNDVIVRSEKKDAPEVKNKINAFVAKQGSAMLDIIKTGTLYMSPTFREYAASNMIDGKISVTKSPEDYNKYLKLKQSKDPKIITISDKNFVDSFERGGYKRFDFTQAMVQSQGLEKVAQYIDSNPVVAQKIASAVVSSPVVNPGVSASISSPSQRPSTTAGKAAGAVGEGVGAVAGGIGAVVGNVASETASTWSTILSEATKSGGAFGAIGVIGLIIASLWKFGFGKTLLGIVGVGGASAIANAAENGTFDKFADKLNKGAKAASEAAEQALDSGKAAVASRTAAVAEATKPAEKKEEFSESPTQKNISDKIRNSEDFKRIFEKENNKKNKATLDDYLLFINKDLSGFKVSTLLSNTNSVFIEDKPLDASIKIPSNFDPAIFRNIMRMYFTGTYISEFKINKDTNVKARKNALGKIQLTDTLSDAINNIHA